MHCPRDAREMVTRDVGPITTDICPACQGMWLDRSELNILVQHVTIEPDLLPLEQIEEGAVSEEDTMRAHRDEPLLHCPHGHGEMRRHPYAGNTAIWIDQCPLCRGVWIDGWELVRLWDMLKPNPTHDALVRAFAQNENERRAEERKTKDLLQALGTSAQGPRNGMLLLMAYLVRSMVMQLLDPEEDERQA